MFFLFKKPCYLISLIHVSIMFSCLWKIYHLFFLFIIICETTGNWCVTRFMWDYSYLLSICLCVYLLSVGERLRFPTPPPPPPPPPPPLPPPPPPPPPPARLPAQGWACPGRTPSSPSWCWEPQRHTASHTSVCSLLSRTDNRSVSALIKPQDGSQAGGRTEGHCSHEPSGSAVTHIVGKYNFKTLLLDFKEPLLSYEISGFYFVFIEPIESFIIYGIQY